MERMTGPAPDAITHEWVEMARALNDESLVSYADELDRQARATHDQIEALKATPEPNVEKLKTLTAERLYFCVASITADTILMKERGINPGRPL